MKRLLLALPAIALTAGCATSQRPYAPVQDVRYQAIGHDPFWMVTIGDDRIVLRLGPDGGGESYELVFPRTLPVRDGNVQRWRSIGGAFSIQIEAGETAAPCTSGGEEFQHAVRVTLEERVLNGCGGRLWRDVAR